MNYFGGCEVRRAGTARTIKQKSDSTTPATIETATFLFSSSILNYTGPNYSGICMQHGTYSSMIRMLFSIRGGIATIPLKE